MRNFYHFVLVLAGLSSFGVAQAESSDPLYRARMILERGIIEFVVDRANTLTARCVENCRTPLNYSERNVSYPMGMIAVSDGSNIIVSKWGNGSAYRVQVYDFSKQSIPKILEQYSLGPIDVIETDRRGLTVRCVQRVSENTNKTVLRTWRYTKAVGKFRQVLHP
jgi:hypothetical protein